MFLAGNNRLIYDQSFLFYAPVNVCRQSEGGGGVDKPSSPFGGIRQEVGARKSEIRQI